MILSSVVVRYIFNRGANIDAFCLDSTLSLDVDSFSSGLTAFADPDDFSFAFLTTWLREVHVCLAFLVILYEDQRIRLTRDSIALSGIFY